MKNLPTEECCEGSNDLFDRILDGEPMFIVMTPGLRERLRQRRVERDVEDSLSARVLMRRLGARL